MNDREGLEASLLASKVSPVIVERVLRLSAPYEEGAELRGIHYTGHRDPRLYRDCTTKGDVIRQFGRQTWERISPRNIFKRGRRKYATRQGLTSARFQ